MERMAIPLSMVFILLGLIACEQNIHGHTVDRETTVSSRVQANALTNGTWSAPTVLDSARSVGSQLSIQLTATGQGDILAAWSNPYGDNPVQNVPQAQLKANNSTQWATSLPAVTAPGNTISNVKYYSNSSSSDAYATWWSTNDSGLMISHYNGNGNWDTAVELGAQSVHTIEVDSLGDAIILWLEKTVVGTVEIHIRKYIASTGLSHMYTLSRGDIFPAHTFNISNVAISTNSGVSKIVWNEQSREENGVIATTSVWTADFIDDIGWQVVSEIPAFMPGTGVLPEILNIGLLEDTQLNLFQLVIVAFNPSDLILPYQIYGLTFENDTWSAPQSLDFNDIEGTVVHTQFEKNSQGNFAVFWLERLRDVTGSVLAIRCRRYVPGLGEGWKALEMISNPIPVDNDFEFLQNPIDFPSFAMNDAGDIVVAWHAKYLNSSQIWVNHYSLATDWGFAEMIDSGDAGSYYDLDAVLSPSSHPTVLWQQTVTDIAGDSENIIAIEHVL